MAPLRKMLNDWQAPYIQSLMRLIETQSKQTLIKWAVDYSQMHLVPLWVKHYPDNKGPQLALEAANQWMAGLIKLPEAKKAILACHETARTIESNPVALASARAIAQVASTIHSPRHCIGLAFYGALAIAYDQLGIDTPWHDLEAFAGTECNKMETALRTIAISNETNPVKIDWFC